MAVATVVLGDPPPPPKNEPRIKGKGKGKEEGTSEFLRWIDLVIRVVGLG